MCYDVHRVEQRLLNLMERYKQAIRDLYREHMISHPCPLSVVLYRRLLNDGLIRGEFVLSKASDEDIAKMCRRTHVLRSQASSTRLTEGVAHRDALYAIPTEASRRYAFTQDAKLVNRSVRPLAYLADQAMREVTLSWLSCSDDERAECATEIDLIEKGGVK